MCEPLSAKPSADFTKSYCAFENNSLVEAGTRRMKKNRFPTPSDKSDGSLIFPNPKGFALSKTSTSVDGGVLPRPPRTVFFDPVNRSRHSVPSCCRQSQSCLQSARPASNVCIAWNAQLITRVMRPYRLTVAPEALASRENASYIRL